MEAGKKEFYHPCQRCGQQRVMGQLIYHTAWYLTKDEEYYICRGCEVFGRYTKLTVAEFARQVEPSHAMAYRQHRASLF